MSIDADGYICRWLVVAKEQCYRGHYGHGKCKSLIMMAGADVTGTDDVVPSDDLGVFGWGSKSHTHHHMEGCQMQLDRLRSNQQ